MSEFESIAVKIKRWQTKGSETANGRRWQVMVNIGEKLFKRRRDQERRRMEEIVQLYNRPPDECPENEISDIVIHRVVHPRRTASGQLSHFNQSNIIPGVPDEQPPQHSETSATSNTDEYIIAPSVPNNPPPQYNDIYVTPNDGFDALPTYDEAMSMNKQNI